MSQSDRYSQTSDGRNLVVRGRLWRMSHPELAPDKREHLVRQLMAARRGFGPHKAVQPRCRLLARVDEVKQALGERGSVWWTDGAPDYNRRLAKNSPYADWFADLTRSSDER